MNAGVAPSPFLNLAAVIRALRGVVGAWGGPGMLSTALMLLLYRRLGEICGRMERLAARFVAGRLWRRGPGSRPRAVMEGTRAVGPRVWPGRFGWLVGIAGYRAVAYGSQLRAVLETPEMVALLTASPQAGRILLPLCRALAIEISVLRPGVAPAPAKVVVPKVIVKRVRTSRTMKDVFRIPLPRGVLTAARRQGFGKLPRD